MKIFIPLGSICSVSYNLQLLKLRKYALPFDWLKIDKLDYISDIIENKFQDFLNVEEISQSTKFPIFLDEYKTEYKIIENKEISKIMINKYNMKFYHDFSQNYNIEEIKEKYNRRIERFYDLLNINQQNTIYFIRDEIKYNIDYKQIQRFQEILHKINNNLNYKIIVIIHNPKNKIINLSDTNNLQIINDTDKFTNWKRLNIDWISLFS